MSKTVTIFVCVKVREGREPSCGGCGSREVLARLRDDLPTSADHVVISPSGCLKKCKKGPIAVVFRSDKLLRKPPKKAWKHADAKFKRVKPSSIPEVLETAKDLR